MDVSIRSDGEHNLCKELYPTSAGDIKSKNILVDLMYLGQIKQLNGSLQYSIGKYDFLIYRVFTNNENANSASNLMPIWRKLPYLKLFPMEALTVLMSI